MSQDRYYSPPWAEYDGDWERVATACWRWTVKNRPEIVELLSNAEATEKAGDSGSGKTKSD